MKTIKQAAEYLGISETTLRRAVRGGAVTYHQRGKKCKILFRDEWLDSYIEADVKQSVRRPVDWKRWA